MKTGEIERLEIQAKIAIDRLEFYQSIEGRDTEREYWKGYLQAIQDLAVYCEIEVKGVTGVDIKYKYF